MGGSLHQIGVSLSEPHSSKKFDKVNHVHAIKSEEQQLNRQNLRKNHSVVY